MSAETAVDRDQLEADANRLRSRLADHIETLDQRVHDTLNIKKEVMEHPGTSVLIGVGALAVLAGGVGIAAYRSRHKEPRLLSNPGTDGWQHPQPVLTGPTGGALAKEFIGRDVVSVAAFVVAQLAKRALQKHLPQLKLVQSPPVA